MRRQSRLPKDALEARPLCQGGSTEYRPFVGGLSVSEDGTVSIHFYHQASGQMFETALDEVVAAAAEFAERPCDEILDGLKAKLSRREIKDLNRFFQRPERPVRGVDTPARAPHGHHRNTR